MSNDVKKLRFEKPDASQDDLNDVTQAFLEFLKDPTNKRRFQLFLIDYFKELEQGNVERVIERLNHMREVDEQSSNEFHEPSNISGLLQDSLDIKEAEEQFAKTIGFAKKGMDQSVELAALQVRNVLSDVKGVSEQVPPWYAKYISAYLQYRDPKKRHRDMIILTVHMGKEDLDSSWFSPDSKLDESWDHAAATLTQVLNESGLKTTYVKNDRQDHCLTMRQELVSRSTPDEFFAIRLAYESEAKLKVGAENYQKMKLFYGKRIEGFQKKLMKMGQMGHDVAYKQLDSELKKTRHEQDFFLGTVPDPNQLKEGLLLTIEISSSRDYHQVRNKMQMIASRFLDRLVKDDGERSLLERQRYRQPLEENDMEFEVDEEHLRPVKRRGQI